MLNDWLAPIILCTVIGATWSLAWWFSVQFSHIRTLIQDKIDQLEKSILDKQDYHSRHDDTRFQDMRNQIWEIRLRNASKDILMDKLIGEKNKDKVSEECPT